MQMRSREDWGAEEPTYKTLLRNDDNGWVIHWNGPAVNLPTAVYLRGVQAYHMNTKGWSDIAYNFAVDQDGIVSRLRGYQYQGGATSGYTDGQWWNKSSRAILFCIGEGQTPTPKALNAATELIATRPGMVTAHQDASGTGTACPGPDLLAWARNFNSQTKEETMVDQNGLRAQADAKIRQYYGSYLGREAEESGLAYWVAQFVDGHRTLAQIEKAILVIALAELRTQPQLPLQPDALDLQEIADYVVADIMDRLDVP